ncbi:MAG: N-6 DNA methylase [Spirochaetia bacterium]|jgi:type I restriction enzyme M protein
MAKAKMGQPEVPEDKIVDFIDGKLRTDSETEQIRQDFERTLIEEYRYERTDIGVDVRLKVQDGSRVAQKKAFLTVFHSDGTEKDQNSAYIIIQVAKPGTQPSDPKIGTNELERMIVACPNARFGCWTNGTETVYFQKKKQKFDTEIFPVNDFPRKAEDESSIFTIDRSRLRVATGNNLLAAFKRCHDFIHANQGGSKEQIFWEFLKILFAKIEDEQDEGRPRFAIRDADERNTRAGQQEVKDRVEVLYRNVKISKEYKGLFEDAVEGIRFNADVVAYIVAQLEKYDFLRSSVDVKGMAYETIVGPTLEGVKGEFFTPRNVVKMTVKMLDPNPGDRILDPACGTGGFIVVAFNYISEKIRQTARRTWKRPAAPTAADEKELFRKIHEAGTTIFGLDFNANLVKTAQMNMVMNNDGRGGLFCVNSLTKPSAWPKAVQQVFEIGSMDLVMTNPPFGTKIKIEGQEILDQYDLAHIWRKEGGKWVMDGALRNAMPPEILFIERCVQFLKPGKGKLGIVLPDGVLGNPDNEYIRYWIMANCQVLASVDLPVETFLPRTGTQTSVLILRRKSEQQKLAESLSGEAGDYKIFMAMAKAVGKDRRGKIIYVRDPEGREVVRPDLYATYRDSTLLDYYPAVEPSGRIVSDDLPAIAAHYIERPSSNGDRGKN